MRIKIIPQTPRPIDVSIKKLIITHTAGSQSDCYTVDFVDHKGKTIRTQDFGHLRAVAELIECL